MKVKERGYELKVQCRKCRKEHTLMVGIEDYFMFEMPNRPLIQEIFPYLTSAERELLISGFCGECFASLFPPEPDCDIDEDDYDDYEEEDCIYE